MLQQLKMQFKETNQRIPKMTEHFALHILLQHNSLLTPLNSLLSWSLHSNSHKIFFPRLWSNISWVLLYYQTPKIPAPTEEFWLKQTVSTYQMLVIANMLKVIVSRKAGALKFNWLSFIVWIPLHLCSIFEKFLYCQYSLLIS